jgi:hypothetical protein
MNCIEFIGKECIRKIRRVHPDEGSIYSMFRHLIELLGEENTQDWIVGHFDHCDDVNDFIYSLHKSLRQTDVYDNGHLDMLLYNLMSISDVPGDVLRLLYKELSKEKKATTIEAEV